MDVSAEAIELRNRDGAFTVPAGLGERGGEFRAALDRVRALAGFDLDEFADDLVTRWSPTSRPLRRSPRSSCLRTPMAQCVTAQHAYGAIRPRILQPRKGSADLGPVARLNVFEQRRLPKRLGE